MANDKKLVSASKPKVEGAISVAPVGSKLPTDSTTALDMAFKCLGYVSEDGLKNSKAIDTNSTKAWGGDNVLTLESFKEDTFSFTLLEVLNLEVLKAVYGEANVKGDLATGITLEVGNTVNEPKAWVIDMILNGGALKRIVIPEARITDLEEIEYKDNDPIGYGVTLTCEPDAKGLTHFEYIKKGA